MPNRTIYHILLVLMFTCLQVNLLAQEATVKGYIFNKESKKALPDITIAVKGIPGF
ncbi:MAG: hypothetical protein ACK5QU_06140 [Bacteroidota bacterium]